MTKKRKIINAHIHVFTGDFVPPYLAKTLIPWPIYYLLNANWVIRLFRFYYRFKFRKEFANVEDKETRNRLYKQLYNRKKRQRNKADLNLFIQNRWYLKLVKSLILLWLTLIASFYLIEFIALFLTANQGILEVIDTVKTFLSSIYLYFDFDTWLKVSWVIVIGFILKWGRRMMWSFMKLVFPIFKKIFSPDLLKLLDRYILMGRFAFYYSQRKIAERVLHQLPQGSGIVILPMDMEYMGAGKSKFSKKMLEKKAKNSANEEETDKWLPEDFSDTYKYQMREIWEFTKNKSKNGTDEKYYPFVFIDPRRVKEEKDAFFSYQLIDGKIILNDCFIKTYMEVRRFAGFKIYPALGYYPFDESLLPIWLYAAQNNIPITSHCIMGTIYYRGKKDPSWNYHPVFMEDYSKDNPMPKLLPELKHIDFQRNFTHPLNYLCLVEEKFLRMLIQKTPEGSETRRLFGYTDENTALKQNLSGLKVCLAHFGGEEEWVRYLEQDREVFSQRLMRAPEEAIKFMQNYDQVFSWDKINQLWSNADWYSIICSLMIRYDHIYADLSYIISKESIYPLLKTTLEKNDDFELEHQKYEAESDIRKKASHYTGKNKLRSRVLFGTDFYVVRNHKSDKDLFIESKALLNEENFDLIARDNVWEFLQRD